MDQNTLFIIVIVVMLAGMMFWQSHKAKQQQKKVKDFRESLQPGTEVITIGGIIGKVVSVDSKYEEIVIDSDGSLMRFTFRAISKEYVRPAYVDDSEVDEKGNPLPAENPVEAANPVEAVGSDQVTVATDATDATGAALMSGSGRDSTEPSATTGEADDPGTQDTGKSRND